MLKEGNVTIRVADMERAIRFYRDTLGFALIFRAENDWAQLDGMGLTVALHPSGDRDLPPQARQGAALGFRVDHLEKAMAELGSRGVIFGTDIQEAEGVRLAFFSDPDGTPMYLSQPLRKAQPGWD